MSGRRAGGGGDGAKPNAKRRTILAVVATDRTFERGLAGDREAWIGKCIHCNARLSIGLDGEPISRATIEHILPRAHGGGDDLPNLAIACARCNHEKGMRHDHKPRGDARLAAIVERLAARRRERWRPPP